MRYLVSNRAPLYFTDKYKGATIEESLEYLWKLDWISADCETMGFDPYTDKLLSIQLGDGSNQYFIDLVSVDVQKYKELLETKSLIGHNLKFDLRFLYHQRIIPIKVFDTFLAEKTLNLGLDSHRCSLEACVMREFNYKLNKEERKKINENLTDGLIIYGCEDIEFLHRLKEIQEIKIKEQGCGVGMKLDNRFVLVLAYMEYCGIKLDSEKWKIRLNRITKEMYSLEKVLNDFIINNKWSEFYSSQLDSYSTDTKTTINWNSPKQVINFLQKLGVDTKIKKKGKIKDTSVESHIIKYKNEYPIIETYLDFKGAQKNIGTYGQNWIDQINPITGRIHSQFTQLMATGRLSSGGTDKILKVKLSNLQNLPSDEETRTCFIAEEGNLIIARDYSGQEARSVANKCLDPSLLEFYDSGLSDMHSFVAKKMFDKLKNLSLEEIKANHKNERQYAKIASFCANYGGTAEAISNQTGITLEKAEEVYKAYFEGFPGLKIYQDNAKKQGLRDGYILISPVTGKKSYVDFFKEYKDLEQTFKVPGFWTRYRELKAKSPNSPGFLAMKDKVSRYFRKKGDIERASSNYSVQGECSEVSKLAGIFFWDNYIIPNNLLFKVLLINFCHDEWLTEQPEEITKQTDQALEQAMSKAGDFFYKRVRLTSEASIAKCWVH